MKVFTAEQMRAFDRAATEKYHIPSIVLMENAALRVVEFLELKFAPLKDKRIVILCGKGNNGGDGFAIARHLLNTGCHLRVLLACIETQLKDDGQINYFALKQNVETEYPYSEIVEAVEGMSFDEMLPPCGTENYQTDIILDALLGTGFRGEVNDSILREALYFFQQAEAIKVAIDIPSACNSDTGEAETLAVCADYTITFAAPKRGLFVRDGLEKSAEIWVGSIGTTPSQMQQTQTGCSCITREFAQSLLPDRPFDAHKGTAGRVVVIGGSFGMSGAPTLASRAVLRAGAGLCITCLPDKVLSTFAAGFLEATSHPLPCNEKGRLVPDAADELPDIWKGAQVVAIGTGISRSPQTLEFVRRVVRECPLPLVIDADALYALPEIASDVHGRSVPTILTPHPGEMGELMQMPVKEVNESRFETATACAQKYNAIVVLKGARSIVATPNGSTWVNLTGNAGMATGGSGDVLTGTIAGLLAQLQNAEEATLLGVYLHGLAGDLVYQSKGNGLIAGDIAEALPHALVEIAKPIEAPANARLRKLE
jgi:NAD(P)H-hydrate epimerase